jgi:hypothetical protein
MGEELRRLDSLLAWLMALATLVTFAIALTAVPVAGAFCPEDCIGYPYHDAAGRFPGDYLWMFAAMVQLLLYAAVFTSLAEAAPGPRRHWGLFARSAALLATGILLANYFVQVSVLPVSLAAGETEGLPALTQYNPHGAFIALEELGYLLMTLSFACMAPAIGGRDAASRWIRRLFAGGAGTVAVALVAIALAYGLERQDRFEVVVISVDWLVLLITGVLLGRRGLNP